MREISHANLQSNSTCYGQQHLWCVRYRTAAAAVELYYAAAEMYRSSSTATAAAVTAPFYGAALSVVMYSLGYKLVTPHSRIPPLFD